MKEGTYISRIHSFITKNPRLFLHVFCITTLIGFDTLAIEPSEKFVVCPGSNDSFYYLTHIDKWPLRYGLLKKIAPLLSSFFDTLYAFFLFVRVCFILFTYPILYHCLKKFTCEINSLFSSFFNSEWSNLHPRRPIL